MKKEFSIFLDLDFTPRESATLKLTLDYRKQEMIRNIEQYRKDIIDFQDDKPDISKTLDANIRYFEEVIEDIENIINKLNLNK